MNIIERFLLKVFKDPKTNCWDWMGGLRGKGDGAFSINGKTFSAHRISYMLFKGEIEHKLHVLHSCDNPMCVNPDHLSLGTNKDNMQDMVRKGRKNKAKGAENAWAKLIDADVINIRAIYRYTNITMVNLARIYKITHTTLQKILLGTAWKHVMYTPLTSEEIKIKANEFKKRPRKIVGAV